MSDTESAKTTTSSSAKDTKPSGEISPDISKGAKSGAPSVAEETMDMNHQNELAAIAANQARYDDAEAAGETGQVTTEDEEAEATPTKSTKKE